MLILLFKVSFEKAVNASKLCLKSFRCFEASGMKVIRHVGVDSRMIILDDQARQQMTLHFQLSLQCNVSPIMGFIRHTGYICSQAYRIHMFPADRTHSKVG